MDSGRRLSKTELFVIAMIALIVCILPGGTLLSTFLVLMCFYVLFIKDRRESTSQVSGSPAKSEYAPESVPGITRTAKPVSEESIKDIKIPDKENLCPICNKNLNKSEIVRCIHCEDKGFTCKMHEKCWKEHKAQQKGKCEQGKVRCHTYIDICISEENSIRSLPHS